MSRYGRRYWALAVCLSALAGYVDALGFLKLGGLFVSFMSGNSTRLAVGLAERSSTAAAAAGLITCFVLGVMIGAAVATAAPRARKVAVLATVTLLLAAAATLETQASGRFTLALMALAMGAENAIFQRDGEVSIGVTYMTGTLVKLGQRLTAALSGSEPWGWLPYLLLWCGLLGGAVTGAMAYARWGLTSLWAGAAVAGALTAAAARLGPARSEPPRSEPQSAAP